MLAYIYDSNGNLLSRTDPAEVPAGQFRPLRFNRDDLPVAGEEGTGRLQVRGRYPVWIMDTRCAPLSFLFRRNSWITAQALRLDMPTPSRY